jgi:hypothetical protein
MLDETIFFFFTYGIWLVLVIAIVNLIHVGLYTHGDPVKSISKFFVIYSGTTSIDTKAHPRRIRFRKTHNILISFFYILLVTWTFSRLLFFYSVPGDYQPPEENESDTLETTMYRARPIVVRSASSAYYLNK